MKKNILSILYRLWGWLPMPIWLRWLILWVGNQKFLVGCAAVVLDERGRVLLFRHTYRPEVPWGLPGGWLKKKEDPVLAVAREIREESGLEVEVLRPVLASNKPPLNQVDLVFLAKVVGGRFRPSVEVSEASFFTLEEMPEVYPETKEVVLAVVKQVFPTQP